MADSPGGTGATDTSDDPNDPTTTTDDPTVTAIDQSPEISLTKTALPAVDGAFDMLGEVITYTLTVTNTGNVTLSNITPTDANADAGSIAPVMVATLAPGDTVTFSATHTLDQDDLDAGLVSNQATVNATDPMNGNVTDASDDPTTMDPDDPTIVPVAQLPEMTTTKTATPAMDGAYDTVGEVIVYAITVQNTGNVTLTNISITDANADAGSIAPAMVTSLAPGDTATFTAGHSITQADLDLGSVTNQAIANGSDPSGGAVMDESDDPTTTDDNDSTITGVPQLPSIDVEKSTIDSFYTSVGDVINYNIVVTNTGNVTLTNISVTDANATITSAAIIPILAPGDSETVTAEHIVTQADIDAEVIANTALADVVAPNGTTFISEDSDDPDDTTNLDVDGDGDFEDPTLSFYDSDGDGIPNIDDDDDDNDGLTDAEEEALGTDPLNPDTDGDQIPDGQEVADQTDPLNPCSFIGGTPPPGVACDLEIANTIVTPDGDGTNDVFRINNIESFPNNTVEIYNRWGVIVFKINGYDNSNNAFRGISNGRATINTDNELPVGVYFYIINYETLEGENRNQSGYLYINR